MMTLGSIILFISCEKDDLIMQQENDVSIEIPDYISGITNRKVNIKDVPKIGNFIKQRISTQQRMTNSGNYVVTSFGNIPLEDITEVTDTLGNTNYTFAIIPNSIIENRFYNLVVSQANNSTEPSSLVYEYTMDETYANDLSEGLTLIANFTGSINRYNTEDFLNSFTSNNRADCPDPTGPGIEPSCDPIDLDNGDPGTDDGDIGHDSSDDSTDGASDSGGGSDGSNSNSNDSGNPSDGTGTGDGSGDSSSGNPPVIDIECTCAGHNWTQIQNGGCTCSDFIFIYDNSGGDNSNRGSGCGSGGATAVIPVQFEDMTQALGLDINETIWLNSNCPEKQNTYTFLKDTSIDNIWTPDAIAITNAVIDFLVADPSINTFDEALEEYYDDNPEVFIANFEYDQGYDDHPIENMAEYLDCFNNGQDATSFEFTIYIDQPVRGEDDVVSPNPKTVGHAFFSLTKNNADGTSTNKTLGFYPLGNDYASDLLDLEGPGVFQDNGVVGEEHDFDVSISFSQLSVTQFYGIILDLIALEGANYDLNDFNCTSVAHALAEDHLGFTMEPNTSLYRWFGAYVYAWGVSPGQYGVDLMEEEYTADVPFSAQMNDSNILPKTSTSNCN